MRCCTPKWPDETGFERSPPPTSADGGYPLDSDLHQMSDDGCPLGPDPARWTDPDWRDARPEEAGGHDNLGEMDTFDDELNPSDRRREFGEMADKLSAWVQSIPLGPATGVRLVYRYADRQGHDSTLRVSVTPRVYEAGGHHDAVIGMIHALIHTAPTGWVVLPEGEGSEVRIAGFDLAIVLTGDPQASGLDDR